MASSSHKVDITISTSNNPMSNYDNNDSTCHSPSTSPMNESATSDTADQCVPSAPSTSSFDDTKNSLKRKAPDDDDEDDDDTCTCEWAACDEQFSTLDDLAPHLFRNHLNNRRSIDFHCRWGSCTVSVDGSEELLSHLTNHLGQRLIHGCRWLNCNRRFASFDELTGHLSEEHVGAGQSKYSCLWERCDRQGKVFTQRQKVMRHIQTHTGDKPYECTICRKRFSESNIMTQHMRTHTGEKPYKCPESGCNRQFSISGALTIHRRVHSGERPFSCKYDGCNKRFAESSNLTKHMRVHTGERPFRCSVIPCGKAFSRPDQVSRHLKTHERQAAKRNQSK